MNMNMNRKVQVYQQKNDDKLAKNPHNDDPIYLVLQYFVHSDKKRHQELQTCMKKNVELGLFEKIILLNEKIYTSEQLGIKQSQMSSVEQINIKDRLTFSHCFNEIERLQKPGYYVIANSDIFFDKTLINVRKSCLSKEKSLYALLRFEYTNQKKLGYCKLFNHPRTNAPRPDSQDVWIYHTSFSPNDIIKQQTNFAFGKPGCDNKLPIIFASQGYKCINAPWNVKTYHYHKTQIRNYSQKDTIPDPYLYLHPIL